MSACSGSTKDETVQDQDTAYTQAMDAGRQALAIERYSVAEREYREAARLALRRDDPSAIGDAAYDLAVTQLAAGEPQKALVTVQQARDTLSMRAGQTTTVPGGLPQTPTSTTSVSKPGTGGTTAPDTGGLDLVASAALYRLGQLDDAATYAAKATQSAQTDIARRGAFIAGLIASVRGDSTSLTASIQTLAAVRPPQSAVLRGDLAELQALASLSTDPAHAMALAANSVDLRRETGDYRAMARALSVEARAAQATGQGAKASALLAQAAQSLGARGGGDGTADPLATRYMRDAQLSVPLQPFDIKDVSHDSTSP
nr:hypothetical protein [Acetobacter oeni]